jgi:predicted nucleic acid-binding protein
MTGAGPAYLVDTNVLIYAYDPGEPEKWRRAADVLRVLRADRLGALSVQVLGEFFVNVTRKPNRPLTPDQARRTSIRLCRSWPVMEPTVRTYLDAVRGVVEHQMAFWDAMIWASARENGISYVLTEDQEHGRLIEDVRYINPFVDRFELERLL